MLRCSRKLLMPETTFERKPGSEGLGRVAFMDGRGELPMLEVITKWSTAGIYLHGAHVAHFTKKNEPPLLFLSQCSRFDKDHPIRGGIPVIFPWFGHREGMGQHGFARVKTWEVKEVAPAADGSVSVKFCLPESPEGSAYPPFTVDYIVSVSEALRLELVVTNTSKEDVLTFENCLHTYFEVGDIGAVTISGLKGINYLDKVANFCEKTESNDTIQISSEVDRVYLNTSTPVEIEDAKLKRKIRIDKNGSQSTVVWNPWSTKAQQMPDFANDEYQRMVCVESGNVGPQAVKLAPGATAKLKVKLSTDAI
jgi:glucose-6-phosphate 1-epimerase